MKKILYLHGENNTEIKTIEIEEVAGLTLVRELFIEAFKIPDSHDDYIVYQQEDDFLPDGEEIVITEIELVHLGHVHFHRCKTIKTEVIYNSTVLEFEFSPGTTGKKALKKVLHELKIAPADSLKLFLKTKGEVRVKATDHIGSFAGHHNCKLELLLVSEKLIEG